MAEANTKDANTDCGSAMDRLYQKMKSDLMFELRNIKHGDRPVTGQGNRESLEQFMTKHLPSSNAGSDKMPSNVENAEDMRPEAVVVEVQGIIERRPVSSILQSAAFRRQLENVIRGSIQSPRAGGTINSSSRRNNNTGNGRQSPAVTRRISASSNDVAQASSPVPRPRIRAHPTASLISDLTRESARPSERVSPSLVRRARSSSNSSVDSFSSARSSADLDEDFDDFEMAAEASAAPHQPTPRENVPAARRSQDVPEFERSQNAESRQGAWAPNLSWNRISEVHQEELVEEISELLHSRLVSSALDSQFRATLELHVQNRIAATGTNGAAVEDLIRSLPPSGVRRNDFSDLGIPSVQDQDNLDTVSVTSYSTHSVPFTQTNSYLSREIHSLKSQMSEMKNMLKLTFDLQMDIQRAIRQEVAAAMSQVAGEGASGGIASSPLPSKPVSDSHCLICLDRHSDCVLYQCGHMCVCYVCGRDLVSRNLVCPVCRAPIKDVIRAYKTNVD